MPRPFPFPIDLVYTWVDPSDTKWRQERDVWIERDSQNHAVDASGNNHYADHDELRYSLRSVAKNLPWIRNIHIVVHGRQRPSWIADHPAIRFVSHQTVFKNSDHLPTFNAMAIGCHLDRIPDLADHYLNSNDDCFFCRPITPDQFFLEDGTPRIAFWKVGRFLRRYLRVDSGEPSPEKGGFANCCINTNRVLNQLYGEARRPIIRHHAVALKNGMLLEVERRFPKEFETTSRSRFRSIDEISPIGLALYMAYYEKRAVASEGGLSMAFIPLYDDEKANETLLKRARRARPHLVCLNDDTTEKGAERAVEQMHGFLEELFPEPCQYEAG